METDVSMLSESCFFPGLVVHRFGARSVQNTRVDCAAQQILSEETRNRSVRITALETAGISKSPPCNTELCTFNRERGPCQRAPRLSQPLCSQHEVGRCTCSSTFAGLRHFGLPVHWNWYMQAHTGKAADVRHGPLEMCWYRELR